jgi:hypothetical protein
MSKSGPKRWYSTPLEERMYKPPPTTHHLCKVKDSFALSRNYLGLCSILTILALVIRDSSIYIPALLLRIRHTIL